VNEVVIKALLFGVFIAVIALLLGFLNLGFYVVYMPPIIITFFTIIFFVKNINVIREKSNYIISNFLFGFLIAWTTLFFSAISGSLSLLFIVNLEFLYPTVFNFGLTSFEAYSNDFYEFFFNDGLKYFLAPLIWGLLIGFIPSIIFGMFYSLSKNEHDR
jgi:hypothetical protein